jgi:ABC-type phosphate transport system substrate-binding protein
MGRLSVQDGALVNRRRGLALVAMIATLLFGATVTQTATARGGGQIGEAWGTPGTGNGQLYNPAMFGADTSTGDVYVGDYNGEVGKEATEYRIQQLSGASGEFKAATTIKRFPVAKKPVGLQGIAVDAGLGRFYVVESCRVALGAGNFKCKESGGVFGARNIIAYSTAAEGTSLVKTGTFPLPEGENELYGPTAIAVDPSNHDILILGEEGGEHLVVQRVGSSGTIGKRVVDSTDKLKPISGGEASSLAVAPSGTAYTVVGSSTGSKFTRAFQIPSAMTTVEAVPGFAAAAEKENWPIGHESFVEPNFGGPQLAISTDGSTLYWKEQRVKSGGPTEPGDLLVRGYSLTKNESVAIWGGGSSKCKITTSASPLAATSGGNLAVLDSGAETTKPGNKPAYGLKEMTFGAGGSGCVEPVAKFAINGKKEGEEPTGLKTGENVSFDASSSELAGGFRRELIWKFGDGTEKVVTEPKEGEEAPATVTHAYSSEGKFTVKLEIKLSKPFYGDPAAAERSLTVGTAVESFELTVSKTGSGGGTVTSSPAGISCGGVCGAKFKKGEVVTLTESPESGSEFKGWTGCESEEESGKKCKVTISAAKSVSAKFDLEQHQLTVTPGGSGSGTVTSSPAGITCGAICTAKFNHGTVVTLTESPEAGSEFKGWTGCESEEESGKKCKVTISAAKSVTVEFASSAKFGLKVNKAGSGWGPVTSTPAGIDCHAVCEASFGSGAKVTLVGAPGPDNKLTWSGCDSVVGSNECQVTMSGAREVTATFDELACTGSNVTGAGSSLQGVAQTTVWKPAFEGSICNRGTHPTVTYSPTGSGVGMREWNFDGGKGSLNTGLTFIGTDAAPTAAQIANIKSVAGGAQVAVIPVAQTAIAIVAHLPVGCSLEGISNSSLNGVFEGRIVNWSKVQGAEGTCNSAITRVVPKDGSGTTLQFKNYLYQLDNAGLACTGGQTWQQLESIGPADTPNTTWPEACVEKTLSAVVRPAGNGGAEEIKKVNGTAGSIGFAALPDAKANVLAGTSILGLQNNGQKAEVNLAKPDGAGETANCSAIGYSGFKLGAYRDVDWSGVFGARPAAGGKNYPLCTLTYALAFHGYQAAGFSEGVERTARDYLNGYVVQEAGQSAIDGHYYSALPTSGEERFDVLGAARKAAKQISY